MLENPAAPAMLHVPSRLYASPQQNASALYLTSRAQRMATDDQADARPTQRRRTQAVTLDAVRAAVAAARSAFKYVTFRLIDMDEDITAMEETVSCITPGQVFTTGWCYFAGVAAHHHVIRRSCRFDTRPANYSTDDEGNSVDDAGHYVEPPAIAALQAYCPRRLPLEELLEVSTLVFRAATLLNTFMSTQPHNSNMIQIRDAHRQQLERMRGHASHRATAGCVNLLAERPAAAASDAPRDLPLQHVAPAIALAIQPAANIPMVPPHAPLALPAAAVGLNDQPAPAAAAPGVPHVVAAAPAHPGHLRRSARRTGNADIDLASNMVVLHEIGQISEHICAAVQVPADMPNTVTDSPWGATANEDDMDHMEIDQEEPLYPHPPNPPANPPHIGAAAYAARGGVMHLALEEQQQPELLESVRQWRAQFDRPMPEEQPQPELRESVRKWQAQYDQRMMNEQHHGRCEQPPAEDVRETDEERDYLVGELEAWDAWWCSVGGEEEQRAGMGEEDMDTDD
jgi:hypothetical protein